MFELCSLFSCLFADFYLSSLSQLHPAEMQEQLLSCLSSEPYSNWELWDKKVEYISELSIKAQVNWCSMILAKVLTDLLFGLCSSFF